VFGIESKNTWITFTSSVHVTDQTKGYLLDTNSSYCPLSIRLKAIFSRNSTIDDGLQGIIMNSSSLDHTFSYIPICHKS